MDNRICIVGAGGHAKVVIEIAEMLDYKIIGVFDQDVNVKHILKYPVVHELDELVDYHTVFFALGNNESRKANVEKTPKSSINLIHPSVIMSKSVQIGFGNVMMAGSIVNASVNIGNHCIINTGACIDHDCVISDYTHVSPRVALAGNVTVGEGAQVGIGACVKQNVKIGKWAIVGAGAVVIKDVADYAVVAGNPAKIIKHNKSENSLS